MNILKLQNELKGVPDNALIGYVQNPTGNVPSYLALSELQRRKDMREKYQAQQAPQSSVADDLQQPAAPQVQPQQAMPDPQAQGVAGLPVPDQMFSGQGMAAGGIVAFEDGGDVSNYGKDQASLNLDRLPSLNLGGGKYDISGRPEGLQKLITGFGMAGESPNVNPGFRVFSKMMSGAFGGDPEMIGAFQGKGVPSSVLEGIDFEDYYARNPSQYLPGVTQSAPAVSINPSTSSKSAQDSAFVNRRAEGGEIKGFAGPDGSYVNPSLIGGPTQESLPWYSGINEFLNRNFDWSATNKAAREKGIGDEVTNPFISGMPRTDIMQEYLDIRQKVNTGKGSYQDIERMKQIESQGVPPAQTPGGGGYVPGQKTQADIQADLDRQRQLAKEKEKAIRDIYAPKGGAAGTREGTKSLSDYAKEFRDVVGEDPMQAKLAARMEKMDAASAKQAEQAPWMALAQAGFGIAAGKSPYALQNIAAGAMEGVKSYGDAQDKMAALEDKRFALMNDMAKAQRAEQLAIASKGVDSRDAQLARDQTERLADKKMANDMQIHLLDNAFDLQKTQLTAAAKDQPDATARATKIWPLVPEQPEYKEKIKALLENLGPEAATPGTRNHNKFREGRQAIQNEVYNNLIRKPGMGTTGATYNYVPGKGIMPL
jgi:hypothetical protein